MWGGGRDKSGVINEAPTGGMREEERLHLEEERLHLVFERSFCDGKHWFTNLF